MRADLASLLRERFGHFALESGHHGRRWLDLELLFLQPAAVRPLAAELAAKLRPHRPDAICAPLVEGAFLGLYVAEELSLDFAYTVRTADPSSSELYPVQYLLPPALLEIVASRRVAVVSDVINAGSAVRGTSSELCERGADPVAIGALLALGEAPGHLARSVGLPLEALDEDSNEIWTPSLCPLCAGGVPLTPHPGF